MNENPKILKHGSVERGTNFFGAIDLLNRERKKTKKLGWRRLALVGREHFQLTRQVLKLLCHRFRRPSLWSARGPYFVVNSMHVVAGVHVDAVDLNFRTVLVFLKVQGSFPYGEPARFCTLLDRRERNFQKGRLVVGKQEASRTVLHPPQFRVLPVLYSGVDQIMDGGYRYTKEMHRHKVGLTLIVRDILMQRNVMCKNFGNFLISIVKLSNKIFYHPTNLICSTDSTDVYSSHVFEQQTQSCKRWS